MVVLKIACSFQKITLLIMLLVTIACSSESNRWEETKKTDTAKAYETFLTKYPDSEHGAEARQRINELEKTALHRAVEKGDLEQVKSILENG